MRSAGGLHRALALRLLLGGLAIAAILGGGTLWSNLEALDEAIVERGIAEANRLAPTLPADLDSLDESGRTEVDAVLDEFIESRAMVAGGHFVSAEIYDLARRTVAEGTAPDLGPVEVAVDRSIHHFPDSGETWYDKHMVDGRLYLQMMTALHGPDGRITGWFEGIYHIPADTLAALGRGALRTSLLVIAAVLATSGLLYPLIASLNARVLARSRALLAANLATLEALGGAIAKRDSDTNAHNYRVTLYAVRLAEHLGLGTGDVRALVKGAFLHDVGKIAISDSILLKPGKLDEAEFAVMKTHVAHGLDIVERLDWLRDAAAVVGGHHEKYDGSGYPQGRAGTDIPLIARIFAVADVFDALTSRRPYKEPFPVDKALAILQDGAGKHFDPSLVSAFAAIAPALHAHLGGREDEGLQDELHALTRSYFAE